MFLAWYLEFEPPHLTGFDQKRFASGELSHVFREVHEHFSRKIAHDVEMLYVVGLMARLCPWCLGDVSEWEARSEAYRTAYRRLAPEGISPSTFEGRGYYGHYFAGHSRIPNGY
jgi:hypothetical protein